MDVLKPMATKVCLVLIIIFQLHQSISSYDTYPIDESKGLGRKFDGIGGLSGGGTFTIYTVDDTKGLGRELSGVGGLSAGATSKLLVNYPEKERDEILDYLFKPNFGASLHILKVEIGGDAQSTDGSEASHMHYPWDENYQRGYEWWLLTEAKKRNPGILLYCLPWAFPAWVGNGTRNPYHAPELTASYVIKYIQGAKKYYNLTFDYVGIWNERPYVRKYVEVLRRSLDTAGLQHVRIVAADGAWEPIAGEIELFTSLRKAVDVIGVHYPGTKGSRVAMMTGKQLWSSEDYSTFNDNVGAGCWARILNQNYVTGYMTSTISWNLIASYYEALPFARDGLMTADSPWSGFYRVESPIWMTAHTTQFTKPGWLYARHGEGVTFLEGGGSMVTLQSPDKKDFSIVIETMSHDHSICIRPALPKYEVRAQNITLKLSGTFAKVSKVNIWYSKLGFNGTESILMKNLGSIAVTEGTINLSLGIDEVYTLTTLATGLKGEYPDPPPQKPFPLPYTDDFESYAIFKEPYNFSPQVGMFEILPTRDSRHMQVLRQVVIEDPIFWCLFVDLVFPMGLIGDASWSDIYVEADAMVYPVNGTTGLYIAARVDKGGCQSFEANGVFFFVFPQKKTFEVTGDLARSQKLYSGSISMTQPYDWINMGLLVKNDTATGTLNNTQVFNIALPTKGSKKGFVGLGTAEYGLADFDNLRIDTAEGGEAWMKRKLRHAHERVDLDKTYTDKSKEQNTLLDSRNEANIEKGHRNTFKELGDLEIKNIEDIVMEGKLTVLEDKDNKVLESDTLYFKSMQELMDDKN